MPDPRTLGPWLRRFFEEYLVSERNLARNTQLSYRDTFKLLLAFAAVRRRKPVERLAVRDLSAELTLAFLAHLEDCRNCSPQTRNQRLTALRTFARFVGSRSPAHLEWCAQVRALPFKKATPQPVTYLEKSEIDALLAAPGPKAVATASCCSSCTTRAPGRTKRPKHGSAICSWASAARRPPS